MCAKNDTLRAEKAARLHAKKSVLLMVKLASRDCSDPVLRKAYADEEIRFQDEIDAMNDAEEPQLEEAAATA